MFIRCQSIRLHLIIWNCLFQVRKWILSSFSSRSDLTWVAWPTRWASTCTRWTTWTTTCFFTCWRSKQTKKCKQKLKLKRRYFAHQNCRRCSPLSPSKQWYISIHTGVYCICFCFHPAWLQSNNDSKKKKNKSVQKYGACVMPACLPTWKASKPTLQFPWTTTGNSYVQISREDPATHTIPL